MSNTYKVVGYTNTQHTPKTNEHSMEDVYRFKETFGLPHPINEIYDIWNSYSLLLDFNWVSNPTKKEIEDAFGVILEKV